MMRSVWPSRTIGCRLPQSRVWPCIRGWWRALLMTAVRSWEYHLLWGSLLEITLGGSRGIAIGVTLVSSWITILNWARRPLFLNCRQLMARWLPPPWWTRTPQTVTPHHTACTTSEGTHTSIGGLASNYLPLCLHRGDGGGIQHWLWTMWRVGPSL